MDSSKNKSNLYEVIGVPKTATEEEIKKAYKKQAIKLHPDRNPNNQEEANKQFQELNRAAKILTNAESRKRYDQFGVIDGDDEQSGGSGINHFNIFENLFNSGNNFGGIPNFFSSNRNDTLKKSPDKKLTINLTLAEVYLGKQVPLDFVKMICCDTCQGRGSKNPESIIICNICNGKGHIVKIMKMGNMIQQLVQPCDICASKGKIIKSGNECSICNGKKTIGIKHHLDCYVRPGSQQGTIITFKNESDWHPDYSDIGDLIVYINSKNEDAGFQRESDNLIMKRSISLLESLTGIVIFFKHLDERVIKINHNEIIHPNQKMIIKGEGMPNLQDNLIKGDLIIIFDVQFPQTLDKERAKYLVKILPIPKKQIWDMQLEKTPENELTNYTIKPFQETNNFNSSSRYNNLHQQSNFEDDEHNNSGFNMPRPVECATH